MIVLLLILIIITTVDCNNFNPYIRYSSIINEYNFNSTINLKRLVVGHKIPNNEINTSIKSIDITKYNEILSINQTLKSIIVESQCTMKKLLSTSLKYNLLPKVLTEFKEMTIGGAIVGAGLESSSFKYGQFNDIVTKVWVLLGNGQIVECSKNLNSDLFNCLAGSYGTLGTILCAEIECIDISDKRFVEITIDKYNISNQAINKIITSTRNNSLDFIEGIQYPNNITTIITGQIVKHSNNIEIYKPDSFGQQWYYEKILNSKSFKLLIPLDSYIFRYDRGCFWMARPLKFQLKALLRSPFTLPLFIITHNNIICRYIFRWLFTTKRLYSLLKLAHRNIVKQRITVMDVYTGNKDTIKLIDLIRSNITEITTPLWLCPIKSVSIHNYQPLSPHSIATNTILINVGVYGRVTDFNAYKYTRQLDEWTLNNVARKMLYSQHTYTRKEFWSNGSNIAGYNYNIYRNIKRKYHGLDRYIDLYDKVCDIQTVKKSIGLKERIQLLLSKIML